MEKMKAEIEKEILDSAIATKISQCARVGFTDFPTQTYEKFNYIRKLITESANAQNRNIVSYINVTEKEFIYVVECDAEYSEELAKENADRDAKIKAKRIEMQELQKAKKSTQITDER